jgi:hypothetical protein
MIPRSARRFALVAIPLMMILFAAGDLPARRYLLDAISQGFLLVILAAVLIACRRRRT